MLIPAEPDGSPHEIAVMWVNSPFAVRFEAAELTCSALTLWRVHPVARPALVRDLQQRGLLDDTLVIWGGEFGRTVFRQGDHDPSTRKGGRDHHPRCFTIWMTGAGIKRGVTLGETDDYAYNVVKDGVHVHDFQATLLHLLGIDHEQSTYRFQGRRFRLTDVHGKVVNQILA